MDFADAPEDATFRRELRTWLEANLTDDLNRSPWRRRRGSRASDPARRRAGSGRRRRRARGQMARRRRDARGRGARASRHRRPRAAGCHEAQRSPTVRGGLATGPVILLDGDDYVGRAVNLATRLCDRAGSDQILAAADDGLALPSGVSTPRWRPRSTSRASSTRWRLSPWPPSALHPRSRARANSSDHVSIGGISMSAADEAVVRRFYEQMYNERKNELAPEMFTADHQIHDPQVPARRRAPAWPTSVSAYQRRQRPLEDRGDLLDRRSGGRALDGERHPRRRGQRDPAHGQEDQVDAIAIHRMAGRQDRRDVGGLGHPRVPAAARRRPHQLSPNA